MAIRIDNEGEFVVRADGEHMLIGKKAMGMTFGEFFDAMCEVEQDRDDVKSAVDKKVRDQIAIKLFEGKV